MATGMTRKKPIGKPIVKWKLCKFAPDTELGGRSDEYRRLEEGDLGGRG